jgi:hypothetical protein
MKLWITTRWMERQEGPYPLPDGSLPPPIQWREPDLGNLPHQGYVVVADNQEECFVCLAVLDDSQLPTAHEGEFSPTIIAQGVSEEALVVAREEMARVSGQPGPLPGLLVGPGG